MKKLLPLFILSFLSATWFSQGQPHGPTSFLDLIVLDNSDTLRCYVIEADEESYKVYFENSSNNTAIYNIPAYNVMSSKLGFYANVLSFPLPDQNREFPEYHYDSGREPPVKLFGKTNIINPLFTLNLGYGMRLGKRAGQLSDYGDVRSSLYCGAKWNFVFRNRKISLGLLVDYRRQCFRYEDDKERKKLMGRGRNDIAVNDIFIAPVLSCYFPVPNMPQHTQSLDISAGYVRHREDSLPRWYRKGTFGIKVAYGVMVRVNRNMAIDFRLSLFGSKMKPAFEGGGTNLSSINLTVGLVTF